MEQDRNHQIGYKNKKYLLHHWEKIRIAIEKRKDLHPLYILKSQPKNDREENQEYQEHRHSHGDKVLLERPTGSPNMIGVVKPSKYGIDPIGGQKDREDKHGGEQACTLLPCNIKKYLLKETMGTRGEKIVQEHPEILLEIINWNIGNQVEHYEQKRENSHKEAIRNSTRPISKCPLYNPYCIEQQQVV